jgi:hypothetical protein
MSGHRCSGEREALKTACRSQTSVDCQHSKTNVLHFLFNLLRIKGLYMFRTLLAHPQEVLHNRHLRVMSVDCTRIEVPIQP